MIEFRKVNYEPVRTLTGPEFLTKESTIQYRQRPDQVRLGGGDPWSPWIDIKEITIPASEWYPEK